MRSYARRSVSPDFFGERGSIDTKVLGVYRSNNSQLLILNNESKNNLYN